LFRWLSKDLTRRPNGGQCLEKEPPSGHAMETIIDR